MPTGPRLYDSFGHRERLESPLADSHFPFQNKLPWTLVAEKSTVLGSS